MSDVRLKRAYETPVSDDGLRVLVDRLWPRGLSREKARVDLWLKEVAPSDALRRWFNHDPKKWPEFKRRYRAELAAHSEPLAQLRRLARDNARLTLLFSARDPNHNNAVVLCRVLDQNRP